MSRQACRRCERPMRETASLCHVCTTDLKRTLATIADLWPALQQAIGKQTSMGTRTDHKPTKTDAQPLPVNLTASDTADAAKATLHGWTRVLAEDNQLPPAPNHPAAQSRWLAAHSRQLRMHEAAADMADEITYTSGRIHKVIDYPDDRSKIFVGVCPEVVENDPCPGEIHAYIPERDGGAPRMECGACKTIWPTIQWTRLGVRIKQREKQIELQRSWANA